jgi:hypothetical protein
MSRECRTRALLQERGDRLILDGWVGGAGFSSLQRRSRSWRQLPG